MDDLQRTFAFVPLWLCVLLVDMREVRGVTKEAMDTKTHVPCVLKGA